MNTSSWLVIEIDTSKAPQLVRTGGVKVISTHTTMDKAQIAWREIAFANCDYHNLVHRIIEVRHEND